MYLWGRPTARFLVAASGYSLLLHHPQTLGMCLSRARPHVWVCICSRSDMHPSHMTVHSGLIPVLEGGNSGKRALAELIWTVQSKVEIEAADSKKRLHPIESENSKMLSPIFLFTAFHKAGTILRITPNFTPALKPENPYVRRGITEHLGRRSTSALLFYKPFPLQSLIYDLCRNPHLNPNLAFNHAVLICS